MMHMLSESCRDVPVMSPIANFSNAVSHTAVHHLMITGVSLTVIV